MGISPILYGFRDGTFLSHVSLEHLVVDPLWIILYDCENIDAYFIDVEVHEILSAVGIDVQKVVEILRGQGP